MTAIATLPPPASPHEAVGPDAWFAIETQLGSSLPDDYKGFLETYGTGCVDNFLWLFNPQTKNPNLNLFTKSKAIVRSYFEYETLEVFVANEFLAGWPETVRSSSRKRCERLIQYAVNDA